MGITDAVTADIKAEMIRRGLKPADLADRLGIDAKAAYRRLDLAGQQVGSFLDICDAVGIDPAGVLTRAQAMVEAGDRA